METSTSSFSSYITTPPPSTSIPQSHQSQSHQSRSSITSLYDLLADLDDHQLTYLIQEMNHTAPQNMAVSQAISAIETEDPSYSLSAARANMQRPTMERSLSKSQRLRLSLQTIFRAPSVRQPKQRQRGMQNEMEMDGTAELQTPSRRRKSPAYKRISRPTFNLPPGITVSDLLNLLEAEFLYNNSHNNSSTCSSGYLSPDSPSFSPSSSFSYSGSTPSPTTSHGSGRIRRYPSTIDMTLEAERSASGIEGIGLGMLEPRPTTPACGTPGRSSLRRSSSPTTPVYDRRLPGRGETPPPVVLDGIFEVLESR